MGYYHAQSQDLTTTNDNDTIRQSSLQRRPHFRKLANVLYQFVLGRTNFRAPG